MKRLSRRGPSRRWLEGFVGILCTCSWFRPKENKTDYILSRNELKEKIFITNTDNSSKMLVGKLITVVKCWLGNLPAVNPLSLKSRILSDNMSDGD